MSLRCPKQSPPRRDTFCEGTGGWNQGRNVPFSCLCLIQGGSCPQSITGCHQDDARGRSLPCLNPFGCAGCERDPTVTRGPRSPLRSPIALQPARLPQAGGGWENRQLEPTRAGGSALPCQPRCHGDGHPMGDRQERPKCPKKTVMLLPRKITGPRPGARGHCWTPVLHTEPHQNRPGVRVVVTRQVKTPRENKRGGGGCTHNPFDNTLRSS